MTGEFWPQCLLSPLMETGGTASIIEGWIRLRRLPQPNELSQHEENAGRRLLVIEDDEPVLTFLQRGLETEQYSVDAACNATQAYNLLDARQYHLVILDLNLPGADVLETLKCVRSRDQDVPVMVLSSRREVNDRVRTLDSGADDFIPKPFAFSELCARARALLRRSSRSAGPVLRVHDLELDRFKRTVRRGGRDIELTPKEFGLLQYLMENSGRCITRAMIIEHVWKLAPDTVSNVVDVYINYLRKKVDENAPSPLIHTLRGSGYMAGLRVAELRPREEAAHA